MNIEPIHGGLCTLRSARALDSKKDCNSILHCNKRIHRNVCYINTRNCIGGQGQRRGISKSAVQQGAVRQVPRKIKSSPCNKPRGPISLWDLEAPTFSLDHQAHRWRWGCQSYAPAALYPSESFLVLISVRSWVDPRAIVRLEGLGQLKTSTSSGFEPVIFRLITRAPHQVPTVINSLSWSLY
jgi:hypothetical protein